MNLLDYLFDPGTQSDQDLPVSVGPDRSLWTSYPTQNQNDRIEPLTRRVGQLNLAIAALVRLCVKQGIVKPAELAALMREIDLEDGQADGQLLEQRPKLP